MDYTKLPNTALASHPQQLPRTSTWLDDVQTDAQVTLSPDSAIPLGALAALKHGESHMLRLDRTTLTEAGI